VPATTAIQGQCAQSQEESFGVGILLWWNLLQALHRCFFFFFFFEGLFGCGENARKYEGEKRFAL